MWISTTQRSARLLSPAPFIYDLHDEAAEQENEKQIPGKGAGPAVQDNILVKVYREDDCGKGEQKFPQKREVVAVHERHRLS